MIERDRFSFRSKENVFEVTSRNANESKAKGSKTIGEFVDETLCRRQDNIGWQMVSHYLDYEKPILPVHLSRLLYYVTRASFLPRKNAVKSRHSPLQFLVSLTTTPRTLGSLRDFTRQGRNLYRVRHFLDLIVQNNFLIRRNLDLFNNFYYSNIVP